MLCHAFGQHRNHILIGVGSWKTLCSANIRFYNHKHGRMDKPSILPNCQTMFGLCLTMQSCSILILAVSFAEESQLCGMNTIILSEGVIWIKWACTLSATQHSSVYACISQVDACSLNFFASDDYKTEILECDVWDKLNVLGYDCYYYTVTIMLCFIGCVQECSRQCWS